jgi:hypothetical protein
MSQQGHASPRGLRSPLRALTAAGYTHLEQIATVSDAALLQLHGMGPNAVRKLREALTEIGQSFAASEAAPSSAVPRNFEDV